MHTTPVSLLQRLRQPAAEGAWQRFVKLYSPLLFFWARGRGLQDQDAADLVQDVLITLVRKLPDFEYDPHKTFRGWLRTLLLNKWRDRQPSSTASALTLSEKTLGHLPGPDHHMEFEETEYRQYVVGQALQLMQAEFQATTWKACWEFVVSGRPAVEVAAELGITVNAVYLAKSRVLSRLRQELKGLLD